ncbi:hypothetical protein K402DRAFT_425809 [Aulographum hederae CBS 113979]|uniref:Uncharacterized protein n=1 Tax=Aulographum hederae CBS 113979 TaxID=1176131 RepID=A0A6G1GJ32_9PEZI|nr:hypothetical protein K402DRAFT_425809 [Aulographum hederae CBS 113979]
MDRAEEQQNQILFGRDSYELSQELRLPPTGFNSTSVLNLQAPVSLGVSSTANNDTAITEQQRTTLPRSRARFQRSFHGFKRSIQQLARYAWLWECLSLAVALGLLIAILVVLSKHDGKPQPQWPNRVTIPSLVALLNTIMKAAMAVPLAEGVSQLKWKWIRKGAVLRDMGAFDEASRGPWGSAKLLIQLRAWHLASLGAFIIVAALAIDPFTQQALRLIPRNSVVGNGASLPVWNSTLYADRGQGSGPGAQTVRLPMLGAIYNGMFGANLDNLTRADCPSANCSFGRYQSLGFCSKCVDVSEEMTIIRGKYDTTAYTLSNGLTLSIRDDTDVGDTLSGGIINATFALRPDDPEEFTSMTAILGGITFDQSGYSKQGTVFAAKCGLRFCVKTYEGNVVNGTLNETEVPTPFVVSNMTDGWIPPFQTFAQLTPAACFINGTEKLPPYDQGDGCTFQVYGGSALSIGNTLNGMLRGWGTRLIGARIHWSSDFMQNMAMAGSFLNLQRSFQQLVDVMTAHIRNGDGVDLNGNIVNGGIAAGSVFVTEICLDVHWPWLILPTSLLALTCVFFCYTTFHTRNENIWKSSSLAVLLHGLEPDVRGVLRPKGTLWEMEDIAGRTKIYFEVGYNGRIAFDAPNPTG